jgi:hypothetical protein
MYPMAPKGRNRDAHATFAGFVFQVNVTILHWLKLLPGQHLELEAGEDIDLIQEAAALGLNDLSRLQQVKQLRKKRLTLRSEDALEAIANFCEHRQSKPGQQQEFRFLTTTQARREQKWTGAGNGIETWEKVRAGHLRDEGRTTAIIAIKDFLVTCVPRVPKNIRTPFEEVVRGDYEQFAAMVDSFEWALGTGDHKDYEEKIVVALGQGEAKRTRENARRLYHDLFAFVFRLLTEPGPKVLTRELLAGEIKVTNAELIATARLREWIDKVDAILERHELEIKELRTRIPVERARTFYEPDASAEYSSKNGPLFDFNQRLQGRRTRLAELNAFLADPAQRIAVLPGRGGIGKTKLLRDWSAGVAGWKVLWVSQHGMWHEGSVNEIPSTDTVLIADDAHLYDDLDKIIGLISSRASGPEPRLKLVIATRPSGIGRIDEMLARLASSTSVVRFKKLPIVSLGATVEIAKEVLGPVYEHLADRLAWASRDTPLITVVGGKLIARGHITHDLLVNDKDFRREVFSKFHEERTGELPASGHPKNVLLSLIAAVQPVYPDRDNFIPRAAAFLSLRPDEIHDGLDFLETREVLVRGGGRLRIVPDLFADYLLELASIYDDGRSKGYADSVFAHFEKTHFVNLLRNFGELDWRITRDGKDSRILDEIWSLIFKRFQSQNATERRHFLRTVLQIAPYQQERVHRLAKIAMDKPVPASWSGILRSTQENILALLPSLLGVTIFHDKSSADAFTRLWKLAHNPSSGVSGPAQRTLKSAIGYERYKYLSDNGRVLAFAEKLTESTSSFDGEFTPFDLFTELLEREVEINAWRGGSFRLMWHPVPYDSTRELRERVLHLIDRATYSHCPRIAVLAARSCMSALGEFHPHLRSGPTTEELDWQDKERLAVLEMLRRRIAHGSLWFPLAWKLHRILRSVERSQHQSEGVKVVAASLHRELPQPDRFALFDLFCTNEYEDPGEGGFPFKERHDREDAVIAEFEASVTNGEDQVQVAEELLQLATSAGISPQSMGSMFSRMCRSRVFLNGFSEYALKHPDSLVAGAAGIAISCWRYTDRAEFARYGMLFAQSEHIRIARSAAAGVSQGPVEEPLGQEDLDILTVLAGRNEPGILHTIIYGLKRLTRVASFRPAALNLIAGLKIGNGNYSGLAREYCEIFSPWGLSVAMLTPALAEKMLANLVEVDELNDHSFDHLLVNISEVTSGAVVSFLEARILHADELSERGAEEDEEAYEPIPSYSSPSVLRGARNTPEYQDALRRLIELMKKYPEFENQVASIFWRMADVWPMDEPGTEAFAALDGLLHTSDPDDVRILLRSLDHAPLGLTISHSMFALHVLWSCADFGEELKEAAISCLVNRCFASGGAQAVQPGSRITVRSGLAEPWLEKVRELLSHSPPDSLAYELLNRIEDNAAPIFHTIDVSEFVGDAEEPEEE